MVVDEITVPSPDFPAGLTFGPVTLEDVREGALDLRHELPVTMTPRCRRFLGIRWYRETYRTRGVFHVTRPHHVQADRAGLDRARHVVAPLRVLAPHVRESAPARAPARSAPNR